MPVDVEGGWDVHTHLIPPTLLAPRTAARFGMRVAAGRLEVRGATVPLERLAAPSALGAWVGANALDGAVVSPPPPLYRPDLAGAERGYWTALVNEALAEACGSCPEALAPLAYLPAEDPELAAGLLADLDETWAGVVLGTELGGRVFSEAAYDSLFALLAERRLPALIHPGSSTDPRLRAFYLENLLGNPNETTLAAAHLLFGGVLHRHPSLEVILAHGGGAVAMLAGRWQRGYATSRPGLQEIEQPPLEGIRRLRVDTVVHSPAALALLVDVVGGDRLLLGSDWPFPMGADTVETALEGLPPEVQALARVETPCRVFGERLQPLRARISRQDVASRTDA